MSISPNAHALPTAYTTLAKTLHWTVATVLTFVFLSGFAADSASVPESSGALRAHLAFGLSVGALTILRLAAWLTFDRRPAPVSHPVVLESVVARTTHILLYIVPLGMVISGVAMVAVSDAAPVIFGGEGDLPRFETLPPRAAHGFGASLLLALLTFHIGAALWHQFVRRDGIMRRMGLGWLFGGSVK